MSLSIGYNKGANLATSFFEAKQGDVTYRVAASDVLPLTVQEAITQNDSRVATPDQIVSDLSTRFSTLDKFKIWAKKRKKKNKKALLNMMPKEDLVNTMKETVKSAPVVSVSDTENGRNNEMKDNAIPKVAAQEDEKPATPVTETQTEETKVVVEIKPVEPKVEAITELQAAFANLAKFVESKLSAQATQVVKMEAKVDDTAKPACAPEPKGAIKEVVKTENPKGHVATSALKAEAMDENWTVNQKELEKEPKMTSDVEISMDEKEMNSEAVKVKNSNQHAGKVKKYFGRLGPGAEGEPELAMDLKSSENSEIIKLRAENSALLEKERLAKVADKIYNIVATLKSKNLLTAGKENALIDTLTQKFADTVALDGVSAVVESLEPSNGTEIEQPKAEEEVLDGKVPQVFETVELGKEDPAELMSQIWNK